MERYRFFFCFRKCRVMGHSPQVGGGHTHILDEFLPLPGYMANTCVVGVLGIACLGVLGALGELGVLGHSACLGVS